MQEVRLNLYQADREFQVEIGGGGFGYRLLGPKFDGSSRLIKSVILSDRDKEEIIGYVKPDAKAIEEERDRLDRRDGNASIELCIETEESPFYRIQLKHIDFGVADNCYVVGSDEIQKAFNERDRLKAENAALKEYRTAEARRRAELYAAKVDANWCLKNEIEAVRKELAKARREIETLKALAIASGGVHEEGCPEDDTCSCALIKQIGAALAKAEA